MAVIRTASGDAPRSGLYASFSVTTPSSVHTTTDTTIATIGLPQIFSVVRIAYAPTIIMSP